MLACRSAYITEHCGCEPIFSTFLTRIITDRKGCRPKLNPKELTIPGFTKSEECRNITKSKLRLSCDRLCKEPCERKIWGLSVKEYHDEILNSSGHNFTSLEIYIDSFIYPLFEEKYLTETKQFLSQLGGNLSLWIGASFLVLFHIGVFIAKLPVDYWQYRKNESLVKEVTSKVVPAETGSEDMQVELEETVKN